MAKTVKKAETPVKATEAVKAPVVAEETKSTEKAKVVKETKAAPKAAKKPAKAKAPKAEKAAKTTAKAAAAPATVKVFVEYQGKQMDVETILEAVKAAAGVKRPKSLEIYVKPEDGAAYYVVNGKDSGKADL